MMIILFCVFKVVGESGLFTPDDIAYVQAAGVKAVSFHIHPSKHLATWNLCEHSSDNRFAELLMYELILILQVLVGESIVKQNDPEKGIAGLFGRNISHT